MSVPAQLRSGSPVQPDLAAALSIASLLLNVYVRPNILLWLQHAFRLEPKRFWEHLKSCPGAYNCMRSSISREITCQPTLIVSIEGASRSRRNGLMDGGDVLFLLAIVTASTGRNFLSGNIPLIAGGTLDTKRFGASR